MEGYDKDFQERESPLPDFRGLNNQNKEGDVVQDNDNESDSSSLYSILL